MARISSGSKRSAKGVEPIMSANMMVTTRLSSGGFNVLSWPVDAGGTSVLDGNGRVASPFAIKAKPHSLQNFATGILTVPQFGQRPKRYPHSRQNFAWGGLTV